MYNGYININPVTPSSVTPTLTNVSTELNEMGGANSGAAGLRSAYGLISDSVSLG